MSNKENLKPYLLYIPNEYLRKVRQLSNQRKDSNAPNKTQKAIFIELLEIGLMMTEPSTATPHEAHSNSVENEMQDNPKQIKLV